MFWCSPLPKRLRDHAPCLGSAEKGGQNWGQLERAYCRKIIIFSDNNLAGIKWYACAPRISHTKSSEYYVWSFVSVYRTSLNRHLIVFYIPDVLMHTETSCRCLLTTLTLILYVQETVASYRNTYNWLCSLSVLFAPYHEHFCNVLSPWYYIFTLS